jgi:hypothetical protein
MCDILGIIAPAGLLGMNQVGVRLMISQDLRTAARVKACVA